MLNLRTRRAVLVVAVLALVTLTAACGTDEPASSVDPSASPSPSIADVDAVRDAIDSGALVIDVRTPGEYAAGHLDGARNIDIHAGDFEQRVAELDPGRAAIVYCASGRRAEIAARFMRDELGFEEVLNAGGFDDLADAGFAVAS